MNYRNFFFVKIFFSFSPLFIMLKSFKKLIISTSVSKFHVSIDIVIDMFHASLFA